MLCASTLMAQTPIRKIGSGMPAAKLASIPDFVLPAKYKDRAAYPLPKAVDNSKHKHYPPMTWMIQGHSCANATAVSYLYEYETWLLTGEAPPDTHPLYTYNYTYHFLSGGN